MFPIYLGSTNRLGETNNGVRIIQRENIKIAYDTTVPLDGSWVFRNIL